jgi:hypothetical protein
VFCGFWSLNPVDVLIISVFKPSIQHLRSDGCIVEWSYFTRSLESVNNMAEEKRQRRWVKNWNLSFILLHLNWNVYVFLRYHDHSKTSAGPSCLVALALFLVTMSLEGVRNTDVEDGRSFIATPWAQIRALVVGFAWSQQTCASTQRPRICNVFLTYGKRLKYPPQANTPSQRVNSVA